MTQYTYLPRLSPAGTGGAALARAGEERRVSTAAGFVFLVVVPRIFSPGFGFAIEIPRRPRTRPEPVEFRSRVARAGRASSQSRHSRPPGRLPNTPRARDWSAPAPESSSFARRP